MMRLEVKEQDLLQLLLLCQFEGVEQILNMMKAAVDDETKEGRDMAIAYEKTAFLLSWMGIRVLIGEGGKHCIEADF